MSQTTCPSCGFGFDNHRPAGAEELRGRVLYGPERLIYNVKADSAAYDTCPKCGKQFLSTEFRKLRMLVRVKFRSASLVYGLGAILILAVAAAVWLSGR